MDHIVAASEPVAESYLARSLSQSLTSSSISYAATALVDVHGERARTDTDLEEEERAQGRRLLTKHAVRKTLPCDYGIETSCPTRRDVRPSIPRLNNVLSFRLSVINTDPLRKIYEYSWQCYILDATNHLERSALGLIVHY